MLLLQLKVYFPHAQVIYISHMFSMTQKSCPKLNFPHRLSIHSGLRLALPNTNSNPQYIDNFHTRSNHDIHILPKWCCRHRRGIHDTPAEETCVSSVIQIASFNYYIPHYSWSTVMELGWIKFPNKLLVKRSIPHSSVI